MLVFCVFCVFYACVGVCVRARQQGAANVRASARQREGGTQEKLQEQWGGVAAVENL